MKLKIFPWLAAWLVLGLALAAPLNALAGARTPSQSTESLRSSLVQAQLEMSQDSAAAQALLDEAEAVYEGEFALTILKASPEADARLRDGFAQMRVALPASNAPAFAAGRAQAWTGLLAGSYAVAEQAVATADAGTARTWLAAREFRQATRFSRPEADATLAVERLARGEMPVEDALTALHADLLDTYQARMNEALQDIEGAQAKGFTARTAEHAALAQGYFEILAPAYAEQRGSPAPADMRALLAGLRMAALAGEDIALPLASIQADLRNFRAAPLSPDEQVRRAGQFMRYLGLVPLEYGRGVTNGTVTKDFEIQEAVTFYGGAQAAFTDLRSLLEERDPTQTAQAAELLDALEAQLDTAATQPKQAPGPKEVRANAEQLAGLMQELMPAEWQKPSAAGDFHVIATMLDQMEAAVRAGDYTLAESARLEAYAVMETGPEARLMVFAPQMKLTLEGLFWNDQGEHKGLAYLIKTRAPLTEFRASRAALDAHLAEAKDMLAHESAPLAVGANAGVIVFREGLEAVVILASLLSSLKGIHAGLRRPLWLGTLGALLATVLTWLLARGLLNAFARYGETLEAVVSLVAIGLLLLITNWFFHKLYWTDWLASFHAKKKRLVGGAAGLSLGLAVLGFTSVYREGFETVLFLQALVLEAGNGVVLTGTGVGFALVVLAGLLTFRMQAALPHKKMLVYTGILIGGVLLTMAGKTAHVLQVVGWLPIHALPGLPLPYWAGTWFGLYPTLEGLSLQAAAAAFVLGSYFLAERVKDRSRTVTAVARPSYSQ
jgi:high-affinity iron transporter